MRDVKGYEGFYSVTICGKVFTHRRNKFMKPGTGGGGRYKMVTLTRNGIVKGFLVHRLVAIAYLHNPDNKPEVNHMDGDRENNSLSNLEWVTRKENVDHAIRTGLMNPCPPESTFFKKGFDPRRRLVSKLSEDDVLKIRKRSRDGENYRQISKDYPIDEANIRKCCKYQSYSNIM